MPSAVAGTHSTPEQNGESRSVPGSRRGARDDVYASETEEVTLLTALQFAKASKCTQSTARQQEEQLRDLLVLIRHGERQDHADRAWRGNSLLPLYDPPLSHAGRKQSFETALMYYALRQERKVEQRIRGTFTLFLVSPFHRCIETAAVMNVVAFEGRLPLFVDPLMADWQQAKVFRTAPVLGGSYACGEGTAHRADGDRLVFRPQIEALRATLLPFLKTRGAEDAELLAEYGIGPEVMGAWATLAEEWLNRHTSLPVWTCAASTCTIEEKVTSQLSGVDGVRAACRRTPKGSPPSPLSDTVGEGHHGCGVAHPESRADLVRRCEQVLGAHFLRCASTESEAMTPRRIQAAVAAERKTRLPKYFQAWRERTAEDREAAGPPALLPPVHVMAITHADVVSALLEVCCPKYHDKGAGYSVPYCSVTTLQRHNNYYRIPTAEERLQRESGTSAAAPGARHSNGHAKKKGNMLPTKNQPPAATQKKPLPPISVDWTVEGVGCTEQLRTRIVIQYGK
ncbi:Histidine phosphatase superfamily (branch 1) [Novymonas esmeraldas]|uniref:Histidine phosphatase superfamily (Branch 1) n=1 Tax=Novymonas esmeraldas TaxID=1808958 RepID=A0AAW0F0F6_9TRYP